MDDKLNIPFLNRSAVTVPITSSKGYARATLENITHVNYNLLRVLSTKGPPGAAGLGFQQPCVHWFGEKYPNSPLYERPVNTSIPALSFRDRLDYFL